MGWLVTPIVLIQRKPYLLVVESAPWRLQPGTPASIKAKIQAYVYETLNRWCINSADLTIFTQAEYQQSLLTKRHKRSHIIHASWIDEENIISEADARKIWHEKLSASPKQLKILFAGRLDPDKGVLVLLEAMKILDEENIAVKLDILGEGELLSNCQAASKAMQKSVQIELLGTIPYGREFFRAAATISRCCSSQHLRRTAQNSIRCLFPGRIGTGKQHSRTPRLHRKRHHRLDR
jgi:glycosyltransferase involved in cell wall biosynthesis